MVPSQKIKTTTLPHSLSHAGLRIKEYLDRVPSFHYYLKANLYLSNANMSIFTTLNQPVAILATAFSKLTKVTNDRFV